MFRLNNDAAVFTLTSESFLGEQQQEQRLHHQHTRRQRPVSHTTQSALYNNAHHLHITAAGIGVATDR
jgi:hypothetical protein